jgi:hypothetical protein
MDIEILDAWDLSKNFELKIGKNIILGAETKKKNSETNIRYTIEFIFEKIDQEIYYLYTLNNDDSIDFKHLYLKIYDNEIIIENISKSIIYSGSEYLLLGLQIIYRLSKYKENFKCKLIDTSFFICDRKINLFKKKTEEIKNKKEEIQHKIIFLLRFGSTFYMPFGFLPYDKISMINKNNDIKKIVFKLWEISWENIDNYINKMIVIVKSNEYKNNLMIRNYSRWYNYWINIYDSWNFFKNKYSTISLTPFRCFSNFTYNQCHEFINWLELYSFKYINYNQFIFNEINKLNSEIAGIHLFKKLKKEVNNVYWINNTIEPQPIISAYSK